MSTVKGRRKKVRYIQNMPKTAQFSPRGNPGRPDEVELNLDQFEAVRLADHQGYDQSEGAVAMGVSRASFGRILRSARKVVANALVNGKIIRIRAGNVQVGVKHKTLPSKNEILKSQSSEVSVRDAILKFSPKQRS